jgi:hypothetical protein
MNSNRIITRIKRLDLPPLALTNFIDRVLKGTKITGGGITIEKRLVSFRVMASSFFNKVQPVTNYLATLFSRRPIALLPIMTIIGHTQSALDELLSYLQIDKTKTQPHFSFQHLVDYSLLLVYTLFKR